MATFFGGETLVGVTLISVSTGSGLTYTVPAGRYAIVNIQAANALAGNINFGSMSYVGTDYYEDGSSRPSEIFLASGQTIFRNATSQTVVAVIREFNNP